MPVSPARAAAFEILLRVETTDAYASELLHSSRTNKLSPADHGLATEIVMGVLRWRSVLDEEIAAHVNQRPSAAKAADNSGTLPARLQAGPSRNHAVFKKDPLSKLDTEVITALRIGAYQLLFLDRIPAHAAINESVELVKKARKRSAAGMVNAVLRRVGKDTEKVVISRTPQVREGIASAMPKKELLYSAPLGAETSAAKAAINVRGHSARLQAVPSPSQSAKLEFPYATHGDSTEKAHPVWLVDRWNRTYGDAAAHAICGYNQTPPDTVIRTDKNLVEELASAAVRLEPGRLLKDASVVVSGDITRTRAAREKRLIIQDEGSQLVALLLGKGRLILDCCAAPGGKTRIIAQQNPQATIIATELHRHRATLMKMLVPLSNVHIIAADIRTMPFAAPFDRILVDAPCTGTGTLARNPDIKWRLQPDDITRMQAYQIEILSAAMTQLAPGGRLLYSTCSLEPEENEGVVEHVLQASSGFRLLDIRDRLGELRTQGALICDPDSLIRGSYLRTIPGVHPCDGFFAALLQREL